MCVGQKSDQECMWKDAGEGDSPHLEFQNDFLQPALEFLCVHHIPRSSRKMAQQDSNTVACNKHDALLALWPSFSRNDFSGMQLLGGIVLQTCHVTVHTRFRYFSKRKLFIINNVVGFLELGETLKAICLLSLYDEYNLW